MSGDPYTICLLIWVAKLETSHVLQSNKNKTYRGRLSVSIEIFLTHFVYCMYLKEMVYATAFYAGLNEPLSSILYP